MAVAAVPRSGEEERGSSRCEMRNRTDEYCEGRKEERTERTLSSNERTNGDNELQVDFDSLIIKSKIHLSKYKADSTFVILCNEIAVFKSQYASLKVLNLIKSHFCSGSILKMYWKLVKNRPRHY